MTWVKKCDPEILQKAKNAIGEESLQLRMQREDMQETLHWLLADISTKARHDPVAIVSRIRLAKDLIHTLHRHEVGKFLASDEILADEVVDACNDLWESVTWLLRGANRKPADGQGQAG